MCRKLSLVTLNVLANEPLDIPRLVGNAVEPVQYVSISVDIELELELYCVSLIIACLWGFFALGQLTSPPIYCIITDTG